MTFEEYAQKHLGTAGLSFEGIELVRMGWNARASHGNCQGILDSSACEVSITPEMIEAGAQRLVAWEDGSEWPDSWSPMVVAAARNDAERVLRSALNVRTDHIADDSKMVPLGDVTLIGDFIDEEGNAFVRALVVEFKTVEEFLAARRAGQCRFTVFGGEA
ncbi:hypothetical protein [Marinobacter nauticus]|uniref:hypothetical protein n=1 Tax=Marinobacter nauticus TaxID=2743 RepID=UPI001C988538|nr:hypothetical protein [Marinobacter nauticus]MBY6102342.1 hypothetical protein [Marinobacter nauticus]